jgi:hypothetical protein
MFYEEIATCQFRKEKERSKVKQLSAVAFSGQATKWRIVCIRDYFTTTSVFTSALSDPLVPASMIAHCRNKFIAPPHPRPGARQSHQKGG